jgi:hypothetical protein
MDMSIELDLLQKLAGEDVSPNIHLQGRPRPESRPALSDFTEGGYWEEPAPYDALSDF